MKTSNDSRGLSTLAALLVLLGLAAMGLVMTYLVATGEQSRARHLLSTQAFYGVQGGIEYAIKRVYDGDNELVPPPGIAFGRGSFTVSRNGRTLTISSAVGDAVRQHQIDSPTEADCTLLDLDNVALRDRGRVVSGIHLRKICLAQMSIQQMQFSWVPDGGERLQRIRIESETIYDNPAGALSGTPLDVIDYTVSGGQNNVINEIGWDSSIEDKVVTMTLMLGDGTSKIVSFTAGG